MSISTEPNAAPRKKVAVIGAGGTIAMHGAHAFDWVDYFDTGIIHEIGAVLETHPLGLPHIDVVPVTYKLLPSTGIVPEDWRQLMQFIRQLLERHPDLDGLVLTHGTASLEETAFFLSLAHRGPPIVVMGAQRPANTLGSDAIPNLRAAVAAAVEPAVRDMGVCVVMDGYLYSARDVVKTGNHQLNAFESPEFGPLARIEPDASLSFARLEAPSSRVVVPYQWQDDQPLPRVDILYSYAGADGTAAKAFVEAGAKGLVVAGFPPGRCANGERQALIDAAKAGVVVVQSSRATRGGVPDQAYNRETGILGAGRLTPQKARVLLMLMLHAGMPRETMQPLLLRV